MNFNTYTDDVLTPRDIRRYPTELERVPSRTVAPSAEAGRKPTFSEVAAGENDANGSETAPAEPLATNGKPFVLWEKEGFGFGDFLDIINPLHHIPIVATLYRNLSGDQIGAAPRVIGGAVWGRLGGVVSGIVNAVVEWWSGKDIGDHVYAAIFGPADKEPSASALAQTNAAPAPRSAGPAIVIMVGAPPAAAPESETSGPAAALRSEIAPTLAPAARAALGSYEKHLAWEEPDETLRVRHPA